MSEYKNAVCRGSYALGTACGKCEQCAEERLKMNDKFTFDQFNQALADAGIECNGLQWKAIKQSLTRPQYEFRVGEVVFEEETAGYYEYSGDIIEHNEGLRPQRLSEMPQAVEDLRAVMDDIGSDAFFRGDPHNPDNTAAYYRGLVYEMSEKAQKARAAFDEKVKP